MEKNEYILISKFNCCGKTMVTVIIAGKAACTMSEPEYNMIMENERSMENRLKKSA